ncbi:MAG TPA: hypothetical protein VE263_02105 [Candidatus Angelobacter sp.]|nr:hypothetical protein [Candidatus Angelobacter sp.]
MPLRTLLHAYVLVRHAFARLRAWRAGKGGPNLLTLKLTRVFRRAPAAGAATAAPVTPVVIAPRESLCTGCTYAHIVRGHEPGEVLTFCGYAYPQREVPFPVRECTDYRPKRERHGAEIAIEGAVSLLPLEEVAEDFCAVTAMRDGEGEDESSYE